MADNIGHVLFGVWKKHHKEYYGEQYVGSVYRNVSQFKTIAKEVGEPETFDLIKFYFENSTRPDFTYFVFNYDKIIQERDRKERDRVKRDRLRERTRQRMIEMNVPVALSPECFDGEDSLQQLICEPCGVGWYRTSQRGRPPKRCVDCRGKK